MPQVFADSINNNPIYATRAEQDQNGDNIVQNYAKKTDIPTVPVQNVEVDGQSVVNNQGVAEIDLTPYAKSADLAEVATSGSYTDLSNTPSIPAAQVNSDWNAVSGVAQILNKPNLATVATSGDYNDLSNTPTIPTVPVQDVEVDGQTVLNNQGVAEIDLTPYAKTADLATVATSGSYTDLSDTPVIPAAQVNSDWNASSGVAQILNKPSLAAVATSGDYQDLSNTPSIPAAQVNSDWNASSGVAEILNKPNLATVATSGDYNDLNNTPTIPTVPVQDVEVDGQSVLNAQGVAEIDLTPYAKSADLATVATSGSYTDLSNTPTIPAAQVNSDWNASSGVAEILNKPTLAAVATSGSYNDLSNKPVIPPAQVNSDWNSSSGVSQILNKPTLAAVATSGSYNDLSDKPVIPTVPVQDVTVNGTSVVSNGVAEITVPASSEKVVLTYNVSTWSDFTTAISNNAVIYCKFNRTSLTGSATADNAYRLAAFTDRGWNADESWAEFKFLQNPPLNVVKQTGYVDPIEELEGWNSVGAGYNCELYTFRLSQGQYPPYTEKWTVSVEPVAFKPTAGHGLKLYNSKTNREVQFNVDIPVETNNSKVELLLGNYNLSLPSSAFSVKTSTAPAFVSSTSGIGIGRKCTDSFECNYPGNLFRVEFTGTPQAVTIKRSKICTWQSSTSLNVTDSFYLHFGLFKCSFRVSDTSRLASEPVLVGKLADFSSVPIPSETDSVTWTLSSSTFALNNVIISNGDKLAALFYTEINGIRYFFNDSDNPFGANSEIQITNVSSYSRLVADINSVPSSSTTDEGKVLTVDSSGVPNWSNPTQVQSDYAQTDSTAVDYIKNKPNLATVATSGSYNDLLNKPVINDTTFADIIDTNGNSYAYCKVGTVYLPVIGSDTVLNAAEINFNLEITVGRNNFSTNYQPLTQNTCLEKYVIAVSCRQKYMGSYNPQSFYTDGYNRAVTAKTISGYISDSSEKTLNQIVFMAKIGSGANMNEIDIYLQYNKAIAAPDSVHVGIQSANGSNGWGGIQDVGASNLGIAYLDNGNYVNGVRLADRWLSYGQSETLSYFVGSLDYTYMLAYFNLGATMATADDVTGSGIYGRTINGWSAITIPTQVNYKNVYAVFTRPAASTGSSLTSGMSLAGSSSVSSSYIDFGVSSQDSSVPTDYQNMPFVYITNGVVSIRVKILVELSNSVADGNIYSISVNPYAAASAGTEYVCFDMGSNPMRSLYLKTNILNSNTKNTIEFDGSYVHSEILEMEYSFPVDSYYAFLLYCQISGNGTAVSHKIKEMVVEAITK